MDNTTQDSQSELREFIEDDLHITLCDFEPQRENDLRCAVCNERRWDSSHVALQAIEAYVTTRVKESELAVWKRIRKSYPKKQTLQGRAISKLTLADIDREITALTTTTNGKEN